MSQLRTCSAIASAVKWTVGCVTLLTLAVLIAAFALIAFTVAAAAVTIRAAITAHQRSNTPLPPPPSPSPPHQHQPLASLPTGDRR